MCCLVIGPRQLGSFPTTSEAENALTPVSSRCSPALLTVAVAAAADTAVVHGVGADVKIVSRNAAQLETTKPHSTSPFEGHDDVHIWYFDAARNTVVISAEPGRQAVALNCR